ncbi:helix-turn-helix domain-containing protein [Oceaniradius stylonematis]|uniref:helix-turn-helix domain-containing protein n=1 Tax=Oceaniradius stylonematis TaxID=2184161 RepID=UPI003D178E67
MTVYTPDQIAERWDVDPKTVRSMLNDGVLTGFRVGKSMWRVRAERLEEYELCQNGDLGDSGADTASSGTNQTEPGDDTPSEQQTNARRKRKPPLRSRSAPHLRAVK